MLQNLLAFLANKVPNYGAANNIVGIPTPVDGYSVKSGYEILTMESVSKEENVLRNKFEFFGEIIVSSKSLIA